MLSFYKSFVRRASVKINPNLKESLEEVMTDGSNCEEQQQISNENESVDTELVAPEGGWGYMVLLGFSVMFVVVNGPISAFGMIFKDFFEKIGDGTSALTLVNGVHHVVVSFTGFFTTNALKHFTLRQVGIFGSCIFVLGTFLTIFTTSVPYLVFTVGVLEGVGFGIMIPISLTNFNNYFIKKRVAYMGVASVLIGSGYMLFPTAIKYLIETYGFRGTLVIISGISLHLILAMIVMQPAEWHLVSEAKKNYLSKENTFFETGSALPSDENMTNIDDIKNFKKLEDFENKKPLLNKAQSNIQIKPSLAFKTNKTQNIHKSTSIRKSSLASLGNWTGPAIATETISTKSGKWQVLINAFDVSLLKDPKYCIICFGVSFVFFTDITFFILEPTLLYHYGFTQGQVAYCITAAAAADLIFRVIMAIYTFRFKVNSKAVFYFGTICITILRIIFIQFSDYYSVLFLTACLGMFRSWINGFLPLVFAENFQKEQFPIAYGLWMMVSGIITLLMSITVGFLRDYTQSYSVALYFLTSCCFVLIIPWTIEYYYKYSKRNCKYNNNNCI